VIGMIGPALCLLAVASPATGSSAASASMLITVALGLNALTLGAVSVSQLDIAPRHAGSIFGLGNTFATLAGLLSTRLTGDILDATGSWAAVFTVTAVHFIAGSVAWWFWVGDSQLPEDKLS
jgi:MFS transporter, ACS family, solute carrier family 17 (sodium-dependent inorganic phosphate cotransporter), other